MMHQREMVNESCQHCHKPVFADEGYYSINMAHYDCHTHATKEIKKIPNESEQNTATAHTSSKSVKKSQKIGNGAPSRKLIEIILASAKEHFETDHITDVKLFLPSPVWRQARFDVVRVEGCMTINGDKTTFNSWQCVTDLIKFRRVKFISEMPGYYITGDLETRRTRMIKNKVSG